MLTLGCLKRLNEGVGGVERKPTKDKKHFKIVTAINLKRQALGVVTGTNEITAAGEGCLPNRSCGLR